MKAVRLAVLLPALMAEKCAVTSDTPIAEPSSEAFDARIPGTWRCMSQNESSVDVVRIEPRTPTVLMLIFDDNGKSDSATVQSAKLAGKKVANMGSREGTKQEWSVLRFRLPQSNILQIDMLVGDLKDSLSAPKLKKAIEQLARENSFDESLLCTLKKKS